MLFAIYNWELFNPFIWLAYIKTWHGLARIAFFAALITWWWIQIYCIWETSINKRKNPLE